MHIFPQLYRCVIEFTLLFGSTYVLLANLKKKIRIANQNLQILAK